MLHQFKLTDVHQYMNHLSEGIDSQLSLRGWEQQLKLPERLGQGSIMRMMIRPGMEVLIENLVLRENLKLRIDQDCQVLGFAYRLSGEGYCEWNSTPTTTSTSPGHTVFFTDRTKVYLETSAVTKSYGVKVRLDPKVLGDYFETPTEHSRLERMIQHYRNTIRHHRLNPMTQKIVYEMLACSYTGAMKRLFIESKTLELILLFMNEQEEWNSPDRTIPIQSRNDLEKLHLARQVIVNHLEQPLSIQALSKTVGLSTTKLKKGFRELFGMTIFDLVRDQRLQKAAWLLETNQMKVCEASVSVGYSNPSNFASAFRKKYSCNPSEFIQQTRHKQNESFS